MVSLKFLAVIMPLIFPVAESFARVDAIYIVPTSNPVLSQAAKFPTRSDQDIYGSPDKTGRLQFALPEELSGTQTQFDLLRNADGTWEGKGTDASKVSGTCSRFSKKWFACRIAFDGILIDVPKRDAILEKRFGTGLEFNQRIEVARFFEGQPIGIIKVRIDR